MAPFRGILFLLSALFFISACGNDPITKSISEKAEATQAAMNLLDEVLVPSALALKDTLKEQTANYLAVTATTDYLNGDTSRVVAAPRFYAAAASGDSENPVFDFEFEYHVEVWISSKVKVVMTSDKPVKGQGQVGKSATVDFNVIFNLQDASGQSLGVATVPGQFTYFFDGSKDDSGNFAIKGEIGGEVKGVSLVTFFSAVDAALTINGGTVAATGTVDGKQYSTDTQKYVEQQKEKEQEQTPSTPDCSLAENRYLAACVEQQQQVKDSDSDGLADENDSCPSAYDPKDVDTDGDKVGDVCDDDTDGDGVLNTGDNCRMVKNPDQANLDGDKLGDACDLDTDGDGIANERDGVKDNCPLVSNADQKDTDGDKSGDVCDGDKDGDGSLAEVDCDDLNRSVYPGATEVADNAIDEDCNGGDLVSPGTTLTAQPSSPSGPEVSFEFSCSTTGCTYECRLDGGAWAACTSPKAHTGLSAGSHTFEVRATANGATDPSPAQHTWTVELDTTAPETTIDAMYANDASSTSVNIEFSCNESGCTFECRVDSGAYAACTSPFSAMVQTEGSHSVDVRAKDAADNVDPTPATTNWNVTFPVYPAYITYSVAPAWESSCAVKNGLLYCWGENVGISSTSPAQVGTETNWRLVAGEGDTRCALNTNDDLYCWGSNYNYTVGNNSNVDVPSPILIGSAGEWETVSVGYSTACGIKKNGTLWCWGYNASGQAGQSNSTTYIQVPTQVGVATNWSSVAADGSTCAINATGELYCWGWNFNGELGIGNNSDTSTPTKVGTATDWAKVSTGSSHTCAVKTGGTLWCWGNNDSGQTGNGTAGNTPAQVGTDTDWDTVTAGSSFSCALKTGGTLWCWGRDHVGQLGNGAAGEVTSPVQIGTETDWVAVSGADNHTLGVRLSAGGSVSIWGWGDNGKRQAGDTDTNPLAEPLENTLD
jgi:alpha-tubulin suppressor-like RCC1 family protein